MGLSITQVDAFADKPFSGNPAAVCLLEQHGDEKWMQLIAREMNLSETAFLVQRDGGYDLRWFTPLAEVELCGHATLASAHFLWEQRHLSPDQPARFFTKSGVLTAQKKGTTIEMDFPATPPVAESDFSNLESALGIKARYAGRSGFDCLIEVGSEEAVRSFKPDFERIAGLKARGVIITSRASGSDYDFVSRFFAPAVGVNEDPVTGSAHCCLGPFWKDRLGRDDLLGYQASARGGFVRTRCAGDRVFISGRAVTVMRGELV
jgi:PhzF family phenazine biosynthesis protein